MLQQIPDGFFDVAFARSVEALIAVDDARRIVVANDAACLLLGVPREKLLGRPFDDFGDPIERERMRDIWPTVLQGGVLRRSANLVLADDAKRIFDLSITGCIVPGVHLLAMRDVTERRHREALSERYQLLSQHTHDIVLFIGRDGHIIEGNDAALEAYGYPREELVGLYIHDLREPTTRGAVDAQMGDAFASGTLFETVHRRKDGTTFPVEVGSRAAIIGGELVLLSVIRDITERRQMQAQLLHADRLSAFGMLAASIAHEINNPLAYAITNLEVLTRKLPELAAETRRIEVSPDPAAAATKLGVGLEECTRMLQVAHEGMARVRGIVRDLRVFSHAEGDPKAWTDLRTVLESSINVARGEIRHRARIERDYGDVPLLEINASRLGQVFLNILVNAAQAIPEDRGEGHIRLTTYTHADGSPVVEISDDGVGIPPEILPRIFEPFHTTKRPGEGTGLGLYIAESIVRSMGGELTATSEVGRGTTMRVKLAAPTSVAPEATPLPPPRVLKRSRILVVDDEVAIGLTLSVLLAEAHDVVVATSGSQALEILTRDDAFDAVLCDVMMPGMTGVQLYERIRANWPGLADRVLFMTGGASSPDARQFFEGRDIPWLEKPFSTEELHEALLDRIGPR